MEGPLHPGSIVILDFGGQYAHLIGSRIRRCGAFSEVHPAETPASALRDAAGIILSGGPQSVYDPGSPQADPAIFALGIPVLGICYGHQWMAQALGGRVEPGITKEYGKTRIRLAGRRTVREALFAGCPEEFVVWMSHGDTVTELPEGFSVSAVSDDCPIAAMSHPARRFYGVQFHVEVTHTEHGRRILQNFVHLCRPAPWSMESYAQHVGDHILSAVKDRNVFMLVSGGVDSTVAFALLNRVLGKDRVRGLLVDTGLMRKNEVADIAAALRNIGMENLDVLDASETFFRNLRGVMEPEQKRRIIGSTFLDVQRAFFAASPLVLSSSRWLLGQGTIYPDTIETGATRHADTIKTHHNRVAEVQRMIDAGLVIEPLKDLYKDEVRVLGEELGLPHALVWRHPFPGPGLGVRILCSDGQPAAGGVPDVGKAIRLPHTVLPVRSVGVQGDGRTYRHAVVLFAENPSVVTAEHRRLATEIPNREQSINRVLLCTSHAETMAFRLTPGDVNRQRAELLREADAMVSEEVCRAGLESAIWQFPVILLPCGVHPGGQSIVLRPVQSVDAMTADAVTLPPDVLRRMTERIMQLRGIDAVLLDLTQKPPGTIEWE